MRVFIDIEFLLFFLLLVDAGGDTTRNLLSSGLIALLENPEQLAWLKADLPVMRVGPRRGISALDEPRTPARAPHRETRRRAGGKTVRS